jgi:hypothetical protein
MGNDGSYGIFRAMKSENSETSDQNVGKPARLDHKGNVAVIRHWFLGMASLLLEGWERIRKGHSVVSSDVGCCCVSTSR